jgi:O-antigen/teichoic acid export membrane protein
VTAHELHDAAVGRLERSFLALGLGDAAARAAAFGATVYLARTLGADLYGVVSFAAAVTLYPAAFVDGGIAILGSREVAHDPVRARALAPALLTGRFAIACGAAALLALLALALLEPPESAVFAGYALTLLAVGLNPTWILVGLEDARPAGGSRIAGAFVVLGTTLLVVRERADVARAPLAVLAGELCTTALLLLAIRRRGFPLRPRLDAAAIPVFRRALPLLGHALLGLSIYNADLIFLWLFRDRAAVGNYAAAYALVTLLVNAGVIYGQSLVAALTKLRARGLDAALLQTSYARVFAVSLPAAVGGALLAPRIIGVFFGEHYGDAPLALAILLGTVPVAVLRSVATAALVAGNGGGALFRVTAYAAATALALDLALIPALGVLGASLASLATELARALWSLQAARHLGFPALPPSRLALPCLAAVLMAGALLPVAGGPLWASVPLGALVYGAALAAGGALRLRSGGMPTLRV